MKFNQAVKKAQINSQLNQSEFSTRLGVSRVTLANWIKGKHTPDAMQVHRMCQIASMTVSEFYDWADNPR